MDYRAVSLPSVRFAAWLAALFGVAGCAWAQSGIVVTYFDPSGNAVVLNPGASISFPTTNIGATASLTFDIANRGAQTATVNSVGISGAGFQLVDTPLPGSSIAAGSDVRFTVQFLPTQVGVVAGVLSISAGQFNGSISLSGTGAGAVYSYQVQSGSTSTPVVPGRTITIPNTALGANGTVTVAIQNTGNAAGVIGTITVTGSGFSLSNGPFLPVTVAAGATLTIGVSFSPSQPGPATGALLIGGDAFALASDGIGAALSFTYSVGGTDVALPAGGTISFSPIASGSTESTTVKLVNTGTAPALIGNISASGTSGAFNAAGLPALPLTLNPGANSSFNVLFAPNSTGTATGTLQVDQISFNLLGSGLGPSLSFTYSVAGTNVSLPTGGVISFSPIAAGSTESTTVQLVNTGTAQAVISNISASGSGGAFNVAGVPALPLKLSPGAGSSFSVVFAPNATGTLTGTLQLDAISFSLLGSGTAPPPLSNAVFSGASGTAQPLTQPAIGLSLQSAYPLDVNGTLTLQFSSAVFSDDPSIQFSTGGRTVAFVIPANTTAAVFPGNSKQIQLQTGTVAGSIAISASFATASGVVLQPASTPSLNFTIPQTAPQVTNLVIDSSSATGFQLAITGISSSRQVSQIVVQFTPVSGLGLSIPNATVNASGSFSAWYESAASDAYGSMFTAEIPFTLAGQVSGYANLIDAIQSVTVTVSNAQGSSTPQTIPLQ